MIMMKMEMSKSMKCFLERDLKLGLSKTMEETGTKEQT